MAKKTLAEAASLYQNVGQTKTASAPQFKIPEDERTPQQKCREEGGTWDPVTQTCLMFKKDEPKAPETTAQATNKDQVLRYAEGERKAGQIAGISQNGKTTFADRKDVENILAKQQSKTQGGPATQAFEQGAIAQQQQTQQQAISQEAIANLGLNPQQIAAIQSGLVEAPIDWGQAITAGFANVIPSTVGGAVGGAALGLLGGPAAPVTSTGGAIIGGIGGFVTGLFNGIKNNIKSQQSGEISASQDVLTNAKTNMRKLSTLAAKDPANAVLYVEAYNQQLAQVYKAQAQIKLETQGNLNKFMEDGTDILSDFELFLAPNGQAQIYQRQLELSLVSGVPPSLTVDDFAEI